MKKFKVIYIDTHNRETNVEGYYNKKEIAIQVAREKNKNELKKKSNIKFYAYDTEGNLISGDDWNE